MGQVWSEDDRIDGRPDIVSCACDCNGATQHEHRYHAKALIEDLRRAVYIRLCHLDVDQGDEDAIKEMRALLPRALEMAHRNCRVSGVDYE